MYLLEGNFMRRLIMSVLALTLITGMGVSSAQAQTTPTPTDGPSVAAFALTCNLNSVAQGRIDTPGITRGAGQIGWAHVDTSQFRYRSINRTTGGLATWKADAVRVYLYDNNADEWVRWTTKGGTGSDTEKVGPDYSWNPTEKYDPLANFTHMKYHFWFNGYDCETPTLTF